MWLFSHVLDQRKSPLWLSLVWLHGRSVQIEDEGGVLLHWVCFDCFELWSLLTAHTTSEICLGETHGFPTSYITIMVQSRCQVLWWPMVVRKLQIWQTDGWGGKKIGEVCVCRVWIQKPPWQWSLSNYTFPCFYPCLLYLGHCEGFGCMAACSHAWVLADVLNLLWGDASFFSDDAKWCLHPSDVPRENWFLLSLTTCDWPEGFISQVCRF